MAIRTTRKCPQCGEEGVQPLPENRAFPFCSMRCKRVDLGKWLAEDYSIPVLRSDGGTADAYEGRGEDEDA